MKSFFDADVAAAVAAWNGGFKTSEAFANELARINLALDGGPVLDRAPTGNAPLPSDRGYKVLGKWSWLFAEDGFWSFTTGHRFAAALMATNTSGLQGELRLPARALRIFLPPKCLILPSGEDIRNIYVLVDLESRMCWLGGFTKRAFCLPEEQQGQTTVNGTAANETALLFGDLEGDASRYFVDGQAFPEGQELGERLMLVLRRLVVGLLYAFQNTTNFRNTPGGGKKNVHDPRSGPPPHRTFFIGHPINVDVREAVNQWVSGNLKKLAPAQFQHVVRGHYKRQVVGVYRSGRKVVWIEPYWRGPEKAPILVRPYGFGL